MRRRDSPGVSRRDSPGIGGGIHLGRGRNSPGAGGGIHLGEGEGFTWVRGRVSPV